MSTDCAIDLMGGGGHVLSGLLGVRELRTLIVRLYDLPTTVKDWEDFENILLNCSHYQVRDRME